MRKLLSFFLLLSGTLNSMERKPQPEFTTEEQGLNALAFVAAANTTLVRPIAFELCRTNPHMTRQDIVRYYELPDQQDPTQRCSVLPIPMVRAICDQYHNMQPLHQAIECAQVIEFPTEQTSIRSDCGTAHGYGWDANMFVWWHDAAPLAHPIEKLMGSAFIYMRSTIIINQDILTARGKQELQALFAQLNNTPDNGFKRVYFIAITRDDSSKGVIIITCDKSYIVIIGETISENIQLLAPESLRGTIMTAIDENRFRSFNTISDTIEFVIARAAR